MSFRLIISAVNERLFDEDVYAVTCPGSDGEFTVLGGHEPFVTILTRGNVRVQKTKDAQVEVFPIERGVAEVTSASATILLT